MIAWTLLFPIARISPAVIPTGLGQLGDFRLRSIQGHQVGNHPTATVRMTGRSLKVSIDVDVVLGELGIDRD